MSRNSAVLSSFVEYCETHPSERFWQAVRNWSEQNYILAVHNKDYPTDYEDTFYWEGRNKGTV
jgi:hypothetical protein